MKIIKGDINLNVDDLLEANEEKMHLLKVGDKIGRIVLGEVRIAIVTAVEGLPFFPFYRTDKNSAYSYAEGLEDIEELKIKAEKERKKYKTIIPEGLEKRITVRYKTKEGRYLWAQIGIYKDMLYWKESMTYQFLEIYKNKNELVKEYKKHEKNILKDFKIYEVLSNEIKMDRLYFSKKINGYASAEYVMLNG